MNFDVPHMVATALLVFVVVIVLERFEGYRTASKGRKFFLLFVPMFIAIFVLNLLWPYSP